MEEDYKSALKNIGGENFLLPEHQEATRKEMAATRRRDRSSWSNDDDHILFYVDLTAFLNIYT